MPTLSIQPDHTLPTAQVIGIASAFELKAARDRYRKQLELVNIPSGPMANLAIPLEFSVARGEQMTVGYWMVNDSNEAISVSIDINRLASSSGFIHRSAIEARVLMWRDRISLTGINQGEPGWEDADSDGSLDRDDFELLFPTVQKDTWEETQLDFDTDTGSLDTDVALYRDPEPLPLYRADGVVDEPVIIKANERRMLWLEITIPEHVDSGTYVGTSQYGAPVELTVTDSTTSQVVPIDLDIRVPCWDTLSTSQDDARFWDYSYLPGTAVVEIEGLRNYPVNDERARIRQLAGNNALFIPLGWENRPDLGGPVDSQPINDQFEWILSGLHNDLLRYDYTVANPTEDRRIRTIVLGMVPDRLFTASWGSNPEEPVFARRQALEYRRLMRQLEAVPGFGAVDNVLTTAAEQDLLYLIEDATHPCHEIGNCPTTRATPDEVSMVVHQWLNAGHDGHGSCSSPPAVTYTTGSTSVNDAMNLNPWSL